MAYLRLNRNKVELVQSSWSKKAGGTAKARTQILASFKDIREFELTLGTKSNRLPLERLSGGPLELAKLIARATALFNRVLTESGREQPRPKERPPEAQLVPRMHTSISCAPLELPEPMKSTPPQGWGPFVELRRGFSDSGQYAQALIIQAEWKLLYQLDVSLFRSGGNTLLRLQSPALRSGLLASIEDLSPIVRLGTQITSITYLDRNVDQPITNADVMFTTAWRYTLSFDELRSVLKEGLELNAIGKWIENVLDWLKGSPKRDEIQSQWDRVERGALKERAFFERLAENAPPPQFGRWTHLVWKKAIYALGPIKRVVAVSGADPTAAATKVAANQTVIPTDRTEEGAAARTLTVLEQKGTRAREVIRGPFTPEEWLHFQSDDFQALDLSEQAFLICFPNNDDQRTFFENHGLKRLPEHGSKKWKKLVYGWFSALGLRFAAAHQSRQEKYAEHFLKVDPWKTKSSTRMRGLYYARLYWLLFELESLPLPTTQTQLEITVKATGKVKASEPKVNMTLATTALSPGDRGQGLARASRKSRESATLPQDVSSKSSWPADRLAELIEDFISDARNLRKPSRKQLKEWQRIFSGDTKDTAGRNLTPAQELEKSPSFLRWLRAPPYNTGAPRLENLSDEMLERYRKYLAGLYGLHDKKEHDHPGRPSLAERTKYVDSHMHWTCLVYGHLWRWAHVKGLIPKEVSSPERLRPLPKTKWAPYFERKTRARGEPTRYNELGLSRAEQLIYMAFPTHAERDVFLTRFTKEHPKLERMGDPGLCNAWLEEVLVQFRGSHPSESEVAQYLARFRVRNPWLTRDSKINPYEYGAVFWYLLVKETGRTKAEVSRKNHPEVTSAASSCETWHGRVTYLEKLAREAVATETVLTKLGEVRKLVQDVHLFLDNTWRKPVRKDGTTLTDDEIRATASTLCEAPIISLYELRENSKLASTTCWADEVDLALCWASSALAWLHMSFYSMPKVSAWLEDAADSASRLTD